MTPATVARLRQRSGIAAIKEATGSNGHRHRDHELVRHPVLSGDDSLTLPLMSIGAKGRDQRGVEPGAGRDQAARRLGLPPATSPRPPRRTTGCSR
jgi:hypothetical protein